MWEKKKKVIFNRASSTSVFFFSNPSVKSSSQLTDVIIKILVNQKSQHELDITTVIYNKCIQSPGVRVKTPGFLPPSNLGSLAYWH
jgi:hypothetical protein